MVFARLKAQHSFRSDVYLASINPGLDLNRTILRAKYWKVSVQSAVIDPQESNQNCVFLLSELSLKFYGPDLIVHQSIMKDTVSLTSNMGPGLVPIDCKSI